MEIVKVYKILTRNDTGETNSHQSGITIPKEIANTNIFPKLGIDELNPREEILFFDEQNLAWKFQYIYYNDIFWGKDKKHGHNEHRLTCVRKFIKERNIVAGDVIYFSIDEKGIRHVGFEKKINENKDNNEIIKLGNGWRCVAI